MPVNKFKDNAGVIASLGGVVHKMPWPKQLTPEGYK
jgi:hypothetical protein